MLKKVHSLIKVFLITCLYSSSFIQAQDGSLPKITLAWDTSYSMEQHGSEYAITYLDSLFKVKKHVDIRFVAFNSDVQEQSFKVQNGNWAALRSHLESLSYDGAAIYSVLDKHLDAGSTIIYTDGQQVLDKERLPVDKGYTILSRATGNARKYLERSALLYRGKYVQLPPVSGTSKVSKSALADLGLLKGRVFVDNKPATGLLVQRKGDNTGSYTDASGWFAIAAEPGDSLLISGGGFTMPLVREMPTGPTPSLFLDSRVIALEEVELVQRQRKEEQVSGVDIGYGETDKDRVGVAVQSIGDDRISSVTTDVSKAIQGKFSGVQLGQEDDISKVTMRTNNTMLLNNYGLIVVDGIPMQQGDSSGRNPQPAFNFVDPENIADITVLKGMAATTKYGTLGANGVILITTKNAVYGTAQEGVVDRARLKNNTYTGGDLSQALNSEVLRELSSAKPELAYQKYLELRTFQNNLPSFFMEAFSFFKSRNVTVAARILTNLMEINPNSSEMLQAVLSGLAELDFTEQGIAVAETLAERTPEKASSLIYQASITQDKRILHELIRKLILLKNGLNKSDPYLIAYGDFLEKEIKHLLYIRRFDVDKTQYPEKYHSVPTYRTRLVFDWNLPGSEFAIQSVNPTQKFYTWEHSNAEDPDLMRSEIQSGITFKDFDLFGDESVGQWLFNVEFLDFGPEGSTQPFLIRCTQYENFGTPQESRRITTMSFLRTGEKKTLMQFNIR